MDAGPIAPCLTGKNGRHAGTLVLPETSEGDLTIICAHCFAIRRVPMAGGLYLARLDDLEAEDIKAWVNDVSD